MSALDVALPLDPLLSPTHWAWLVALFMATIATLSRFPLLAFLMGSKRIGKFVSSSCPSQQEAGPCEAEQGGSKLSSTASTGSQAEEVEEEKPCSSADQRAGADSPLAEEEWNRRKGRSSRAGLTTMAGNRGSGRGEENRGSLLRGSRTGEGIEEDPREKIPPPWVYSLLVASETPTRASSFALDAFSNICTPDSSLTSSWSQALHTRISARLGKQWDIVESCELPLLRSYSPLPTSEIVRKLACQAPPPLQSLISATEIDSQDHGFAILGFSSGEIWLWDREKEVCANRLYGRKSPVSSVGVLTSLSYPRIAIAAGPHYLYRQSSLVTLWDDRCMLQSMDCSVCMPAGKMEALTCRAFDICIAGGGFASVHDARMLRREPFCIYSSQYVSRVDAEGVAGHGNISKERRNDLIESKDENSNEMLEQLEECEISHTLLPSSTSQLHVEPPQGKRKCPLLSNCLPFTCLFDKQLHTL
ncbi:hypothetical protein GOP47_0002270 [Adiantum capillus-veneris]|uniref:Uncharacterized protein n=1 Tax=Adiantum capillus-veneris TaxID=13818 RepID=A0A9D4VBS9_ADICA|nr:hypothetical protein GOP47_0002270 [Adiantum capillus-veneris]